MRRHEIRINRNQQEEVKRLNEITQRKKGLATELRAVIDRVKAMDYESKDLTNECQAKSSEYEEKMRDATGNVALTRLKQAVHSLKVSASRGRAR